MTRTFVVQLPNRVGELAHLSRALASRGVDIRHVACFGSGSLASAFVIPNDDQTMREVLRGLGYGFIEGEPVIVAVDDRPGGLADIAERLASAGVMILGSICIGEQPGVIEMAFTVDDEARARVALGLDPATVDDSSRALATVA